MDGKNVQNFNWNSWYVRPRRRCENNIKIILKGVLCEVVGRIYCVQNWYQSPAVRLDTQSKLRFSQKAGSSFHILIYF
jgi:hypothetical protein